MSVSKYGIGVAGLGFVCMILTACADLQKVLKKPLGSAPLTEAEVIMGLKEALSKGTGIAVSGLSTKDGFYQDALIKILLPEDTQKVVGVVKKLPGGKRLIDDVVLRMNRAAEDAASEAGPIFLDAIKALTIEEGFKILTGPEDAATNFLRQKTYASLERSFVSVIDRSLDKVLVGNVSTNQSWEFLLKKYNTFANSIAGKLAGVKPYNQKLGVYVTRKALDAVFLKLADEEKKIRKEPLARTTALLKRVFGSLDK